MNFICHPCFHVLFLVPCSLFLVPSFYVLGKLLDPYSVEIQIRVIASRTGSGLCLG